MRVTLREVAARADVSIATASRALNGLPVSEETKARVERAVSELGYVANEAARALRSDRTMTMGLVFHELRNVLGIDLLDALSESIESAGYSLLISTARGDAERYDVLLRHFLERRVDALFCVRPRGEGATLARYTQAAIPVVALFDATGAFADLPVVQPAFDEPAHAIAQHLVELGHRRVALLGAATAAPPLTAIAAALRETPVHVARVELGEVGGVREALDGLMRTRRRPTAIIAPDPAVRGVLSVCDTAGLRVPDDVSVIGVCEITAEPHQRKRGISSFTIDPHRVGRAAGGAMLAWLSGARPAPRVRVQAATFSPRRTSGPAPS